MAEGQLARRVDSLEEYMKELSYQALKTERELARLSSEMREFKDEMREFKDEMREFKDEMREFKEEMLDFKDEMRGFKDEMSDFKTRAEQDRREMNRKWGELANKMGTMVEDLVAPNLPRVARELFACEQPDLFAVRIKRRRGPRTLELDALLVCSQMVLLNETKSSITSRDIDDLGEKLITFSEFFPEYVDRRCIGVAATLYMDDSVISYATNRRVLAMCMADDTMGIVNPEAVQD